MQIFTHITAGGRIQLKCGGTRWRTGGEVKGKLANGVGSQYPSHYLGTWCIQLMQTSRLPVVEWTDAPADLNGLVRFAERLNLVSARVPSHFNWPLPAACVSYPHLLYYLLKVTSRKRRNMSHVTRIYDNDPEFSAWIYWFPKVYGQHYLPTYFFLISFRVVFLRNDCSVTNRAQLTHWKRTLEMKSGKLTAWHWNAVSTTCNAATG